MFSPELYNTIDRDIMERREEQLRKEHWPQRSDEHEDEFLGKSLVDPDPFGSSERAAAKEVQFITADERKRRIEREETLAKEKRDYAFQQQEMKRRVEEKDRCAPS